MITVLLDKMDVTIAERDFLYADEWGALFLYHVSIMPMASCLPILPCSCKYQVQSDKNVIKSSSTFLPALTDLEARVALLEAVDRVKKHVLSFNLFRSFSSEYLLHFFSCRLLLFASTIAERDPNSAVFKWVPKNYYDLSLIERG